MMPFKPIQALLAASLLLLAVGCEGAFSFMPEPTPTPLPTRTSTPTHTPAPTATLTPSPVPRKLILGCVPSPDGHLLAVVDDRGVRVYETASYGEVWRAPVTGMLDELRYNQVQIAWADDSTALTVSISQELYSGKKRFISHLSRFDAASGTLQWQRTFEDHPHVTFAPDGNHFVLMPIYCDTAELWNGLVPERTGTLELPPHASLFLMRVGYWSPDGSLIAAKMRINSPAPAVKITPGASASTARDPAEEQRFMVWDALTGNLVAELHDWRQGINYQSDVRWSPDGSYLISDEGGRFILWDTQAWTYHAEIAYEAPYNVGSIELSPDGTKLMSILYHITIEADRRFAIHVWEMPSGRRLYPAGGAPPGAPHFASLDFVGWMPDGSSFLYELDERIIGLDTRRKRAGEAFPVPAIDWNAWWPPINTVYLDYYQLSPDGKYIYFVEPQAVVIYDVLTGEIVDELAD